METHNFRSSQLSVLSSKLYARPSETASAQMASPNGGRPVVVVYMFSQFISFYSIAFHFILFKLGTNLKPFESLSEEILDS